MNKKMWNNMKEDFKNGEYNFPALLILVAVLLVFVGVRLIGISKTEKHLTERQNQIIEQLDAFADIQGLLAEQIEVITSSSQSSLDSLRQQTEDRLADARDAIENARLNLEDKLALQSQATRNAISTWESRIPQIECSFVEEGGDAEVQQVTLSRGSGTFFTIDNEVTILSNRHVFEEDNKVLRDCKVVFPNETQVVSFGMQSVILSEENGIDFGKAVLNNPPDFVSSRTAYSEEFCQDKASIGDNIIILGYPRIGSDKGITVTEGIISGFDGDFYVTSAKVARGTSGGAAILVEKNCYLGLPTFAAAGQVESLARILGVDAI